MDDYELERYCERHSNCNCLCLKCPAFIANQRNELGIDECDDDDME